ncbi:hypothetical protein M8542_28340 [Amycolatopsis sp. OK19-0408]|uniref:GerMN domain-containing protein n=1 Tax=Amycolatopsis iheyensis TaxID=2945988 RepID=A0A9X2SM23_9PSEU|nr:hypothetical protein [Amycolatopsis iheyensis]MCR6486743.1 hypothetical protein [Amycolatopsis iheyensis]
MKKLLVLAVLLLVSACGIKPTGVVPAGPAPTLRNTASSGRGSDLVLYFVLDGRAAPVSRPSRGTVDVGTALATLLGGPTSTEQSEGYQTMLPPEAGPIGLSPGAQTVISFAFPLRELSSTAINQLICTASAALAANGTYAVDGGITLTGTDTKLPPQTCQAY